MLSCLKRDVISSVRGDFGAIAIVYSEEMNFCCCNYVILRLILENIIIFLKNEEKPGRWLWLYFGSLMNIVLDKIKVVLIEPTCHKSNEVWFKEFQFKNKYFVFPETIFMI